MGIIPTFGSDGLLGLSGSALKSVGMKILKRNTQILKANQMVQALIQIHPFKE